MPRRKEIRKIGNSSISFCLLFYQLFSCLHAKYTHPFPKVEESKALVRTSNLKPRISVLCSNLYICYRYGFFWSKDCAWKDKLLVPVDRITTIKIPIWKEAQSKDKHSAAAVLKSCWAAILRTLDHPGEWGMFLPEALTLLSGGNSLFIVLHCSWFFLWFIFPCPFSSLATSWMSVVGNMPSLGAEQLLWSAFLPIDGWRSQGERSWSLVDQPSRYFGNVALSET